MGNSGSSTGHSTPHFIKRNESFGPSSPRHVNKHNVEQHNNQNEFGSTDRIASLHTDRGHRRPSYKKANRSQSLEQRSVLSSSHSPSSSQSSSNSYLNAIVTEKGGCLRQSTQPKFQISGDLNPHQVNTVKHNWKRVLKVVNEDETEIAILILLRIFQLDHRNQVLFGLGDIPFSELRINPIFLRHVKAFEPTLVNVMSHPTNATTLSKYLQQLGGRHVQYTGVTYKCSYWKTFIQALIDVVGVDKNSGDVHESLFLLGNFCVEQMKIGYKIEYLLQREAERIVIAQQKKRSGSNSTKKVTYIINNKEQH